MPIEIDNKGEIVDRSIERRQQDIQGVEVNEIVSKRPSFIIRWGITILLGIAFIALLGTYFISYPEIVKAKGVLNSLNAPKEVIIRSNGRIAELFIKEEQAVRTDDVLGYIGSTANYYEVSNLSKMLQDISILTDTHPEKITDFLKVPFNDLGELQTPYRNFQQSLLNFSYYLNNGFYIKKKKMLETDPEFLNRLRNEQLKQLELIQQDIAIADSNFLVQQLLNDQKVISSLDYRNEKSRLISKKISLPDIALQIITNESTQHAKQKEIFELENQIGEQKNIFVQSLNTLKSYVAEWKRKYLLVSPINGKVSFASFIQQGREVKDGQLICYINPGDTDYYIEAAISQKNFGKIMVGQSVRLKFPAYPNTEFGTVKGRIDFINHIPTDSGYMAKISLPHGLTTNFRKNITYRSGLLADAEIVTENRRLIDRLLGPLRGLSVE